MARGRVVGTVARRRAPDDGTRRRRRAGRHPRPATGGARRPGRARPRGGRDARRGALRSRRPRRGARRRGSARSARSRAARSRARRRPRCDYRHRGRRAPADRFSQTAGDARAFAAPHRYRIDINQESVGQGMAIVGVLSVGVLAGVVIGVALSLTWLVYVSTRPPMPLLGREAGTDVFRDLESHPGDETLPGIAVLRLDGALFFATTEALEDRVRGLAADADRQALVLDLAAVTFIDSQGAAKLTEIHELTEAQ